MRVTVLTIILFFNLNLPTQAKEPLVVLTDIAPIHSLVSMITGDDGSDGLLLDATSSPHNYALRPSDSRKIVNADLIIYTSKSLTPWLNRLIESLAPDTPTLELISLEGTQTWPNRNNNVFEDDQRPGLLTRPSNLNPDRVSSEDPHAWLDPANAVVWAEAIASQLIMLDPENSERYSTNLLSAKQTLKELLSSIDKAFQYPLNAYYIVFHDSYQYFERRFDLPARGAVNLYDGAHASISQLNQLQQLLKQQPNTCVLSEPQFSQRLITTIVGKSQLATGQLDPLGVSLTPGATLYPELLTTITNNLKTCLITAAAQVK